jgi:3-phenylpropionate/trans-cinnamate dioxygenase ferredoxin reductase subunit
MTEFTADVLLIGGGVASANAAEELRVAGFNGSVMLVTRELDAPYHRPPITKGLLRTGAAEQPLEVHPEHWWAERDVSLLTRAAVSSMALDAHTATLANKNVIHFAQALVATGSMVRRLNIDGAALDGIHYLRTPANAEKLRREAADAERIVLVGGSFIAVEVAAQMAALGHRCTLVMQEGQCLERTFGATVGDYVTRLLHDHGVETVCGVDVVAFTGDGRVTGIRTADGQQVDGDLVVVGAGAVPDTKIAARAGLDIGPTGGICCDRNLRTSAPDVFAAGDVCEYDSVVHGRALRVEHEAHAAAQGVTAARNMLGADTPHSEVPYFWTEIADWTTLEYVGPAHQWNEEIVSGSVDDGHFTVWYFSDDRLVAALTAGRPQDLETARQYIVAGTPARTDIHDMVELSPPGSG